MQKNVRAIIVDRNARKKIVLPIVMVKVAAKSGKDLDALTNAIIPSVERNVKENDVPLNVMETAVEMIV